MDAGTLIAAEDKQDSGSNQPKDGQPRDGGQSGEPAPRGKEARPAAERKRARNLSEDKRFKLFSGTANPELARKIAQQVSILDKEVAGGVDPSQIIQIGKF